MKRSQKGFINPNGWQWFLLSMVIVAGVAGWVLIETALWLLSHLTIGWA